MMEKEKLFLNIIIFITIINSISLETTYILMDHLFGQIDIVNPICFMKEQEIPSFRGKIENLDDILKIMPKDNLYDNPFVFISGKEKLNYVKYFSDKTYFFTDFKIFWEDIRASFCFVQIEKWDKYNYIIMTNSQMGYIFFPICFFLFAYSVPIAIFKLYKSELKRLVLFKKIQFYIFAQKCKMANKCMIKA